MELSGDIASHAQYKISVDGFPRTGGPVRLPVLTVALVVRSQRSGRQEPQNPTQKDCIRWKEIPKVERRQTEGIRQRSAVTLSYDFR